MASPPDKAVIEMTPPRPDELAAWADQYGPALRRYFTRKAGQSNAEDLVQEVFLHLQARAGQTPSDNIERYLFTVARNVLIDRFRSDFSRRSALHHTLNEAIEAADVISPERILAAKQEYARAIVAIVDMPPRMQTAFMLHRFAKMSFSAIAKRMGVSKSTVQTLVRRAMRRMLDSLEDRA